MIFLSQERVHLSFCIMWHSNTEFFLRFHIQRLNLTHTSSVCLAGESSLPHSASILPWGAHRVFTSSCLSFVLGKLGVPIFIHSSCSRNLCMCEFSSEDFLVILLIDKKKNIYFLFDSLELRVFIWFLSFSHLLSLFSITDWAALWIWLGYF